MTPFRLTRALSLMSFIRKPFTADNLAMQIRTALDPA